MIQNNYLWVAEISKAAKYIMDSQFNINLFIPISLIAEGGGPIKITPSFAHCSQNSTFSDKNP